MPWNSEVVLTKEACHELAFWGENVDSLNFIAPGYLCNLLLILSVPTRRITPVVLSLTMSTIKIFHQKWSPAESSKSSTWRKHRTVVLALSAFAPDLQGKRVAWITDNTSFVAIVQNGSKVTELQSLGLYIFNICVRSGIFLEMKWIPRNLNYRADLLSRTIDFEVVDAFTQNWECENNWILPSVSQISRVITHMRACKAVGTLVIPIWKSSYFWVLLCEDGKHWNEFVHDWVILPKYKHLFIRGNAKNHVFGS